jgi:hypothetical protein
MRRSEGAEATAGNERDFALNEEEEEDIPRTASDVDEVRDDVAELLASEVKNPEECE